MKRIILLLLALLLALGALGALAEESAIELLPAEAEVLEADEFELWTEDMAAADAESEGAAEVLANEAGAGVKIDAAHFPDATFRAYVQANFDGDKMTGKITLPFMGNMSVELKDGHRIS